MLIHFGQKSFDEHHMKLDFDEMKDYYRSYLAINPANKFKQREEEPIAKEQREQMIDYMMENSKTRYHRFLFV